MQQTETLYMVVPCYNESAALPEAAARLGDKCRELMAGGRISERSRIVFVNDGSTDDSWQLIRALHEQQPELYSGINLARNSGHQNAVLAGLMTVRERADIVITMDADLQDDVNAIDEMLQKYSEGNQVVYGVRSARRTDSFFKRFTARRFYGFMRAMGTGVINDHADFRLMSRRVLQELANFREVNLFLRGIVPLIGFQSCCVYYERGERFAGKSKYSLGKMLAFAINGITSFSTRPLKMITVLGFLMSLISAAAFVWAFVAKALGSAELGWPSLMCSVWFLGGLQLLCLGVIGEYIGKIYAEVKQRPRYIVAEFLDDEQGK